MLFPDPFFPIIAWIYREKPLWRKKKYKQAEARKNLTTERLNGNGQTSPSLIVRLTPRKISCPDSLMAAFKSLTSNRILGGPSGKAEAPVEGDSIERAAFSRREARRQGRSHRGRQARSVEAACLGKSAAREDRKGREPEGEEEEDEDEVRLRRAMAEEKGRRASRWSGVSSSGVNAVRAR